MKPSILPSNSVRALLGLTLLSGAVTLSGCSVESTTKPSTVASTSGAASSSAETPSAEASSEATQMSPAQATNDEQRFAPEVAASQPVDDPTDNSANFKRDRRTRPQSLDIDLSGVSSSPAKDSAIKMNAQKERQSKELARNEAKAKAIANGKKDPYADQRVSVPTAENRKAKIVGFEGSELIKDFGEVLAGDKGQHVFSLISDGEEPLVIAKIKPSCGCTLARTTLVNADGTTKVYTIGDEIPVGTRFEIETQLKTDGRSGPLNTNVQITGNTPEPVTNLRLKAKVKPILEVKPKPNLNFGQMVTNERREDSLTISSEVLEPFTLMVDEKFVVDPLEVSLEPINPNAEGKSTEWKVNVALGPKVLEGFRNYPLRFTTDIPVPKGKTAKNYEPRVYVQAQVMGLVSAKPAFVSFGVVRPGQQVTRKVTIECMDDFQLSEDMEVVLEPLQKNIKVDYLDGFETSLVIVDQAKSIAQLTVTLNGMPDDFNASFGGMLKVKVNHPEKDVVDVRFSGVCRPGVPNAGVNQTKIPGQLPGIQKKK